MKHVPKNRQLNELKANKEKLVNKLRMVKNVVITVNRVKDDQIMIEMNEMIPANHVATSEQKIGRKIVLLTDVKDEITVVRTTGPVNRMG